MRVVSLVPSVTETLLAWQITPIACTRFCEQPELPHVGGTKNPDIETIVGLKPDLVVMERDENRLEDHQALSQAGIATEVLHVTSLQGLSVEMVRLAKGLNSAVGPGVEHAASRLIDELANTLAATANTAPQKSITAFVPIWRKPWMTINHATYGASMLAHLGIELAFAEHADRYPTVSAADIADAVPDLVLAPTEPYPFAPRHLAELSRFAPAHLVDGQDLFWWGSRTPAAIKRLEAHLAGLIQLPSS